MTTIGSVLIKLTTKILNFPHGLQHDLINQIWENEDDLKSSQLAKSVIIVGPADGIVYLENIDGICSICNIWGYS